MSKVTVVDLPFADGIYTFRLGLAQINELQEKCGAGLGAIFARVIRGRYAADDEGGTFGSIEEGAYHIGDLYHTIRLGLIGGGTGIVDEAQVTVSPLLARSLADRYVIDRPKQESWGLAAAVLMACIEGYEPKKDLPLEATEAAQPAA